MPISNPVSVFKILGEKETEIESSGRTGRLSVTARAFVGRKSMRTLVLEAC